MEHVIRWEVRAEVRPDAWQVVSIASSEKAALAGFLVWQRRHVAQLIRVWQQVQRQPRAYLICL